MSWAAVAARLRRLGSSRRDGGGAGRRARRLRLIDRLAAPPDAFLRVLFDAGPTGVVIADRSLHVVRANAAMLRLAARPLGDGAPLSSLFDAADRERLEAALRATMAGAPPLQPLVTRLAALADPHSQVAVALSPLHEADGTVSGVILHVTDITGQARLEGQLAQAQKLQAVGQMAAGIAHDFNNLLTTIQAASDLALERDGLDEESRADLLQIRAGAERGAALVRQLLAFARQQRMQPRIVAVNEAVQDVAGLLGRLVGRGIAIALDLEAPGRHVRVDPTQLDQVLINLIVNARDAMPDGGSLTLRTGHSTLYRPITQAHETIPPGRYVMIEVADTGAGIPPEILPRIFDPFFTTRRERGGNGLGLSTVHGVVRQSGGYVAVDSAPGQGTRIRLYLPRHDPEPAAVAAPAPSATTAARAPPAATAAPAPPPASPAACRTVLLVDDEDPIRRLAERAFAQRGWRVLAADCAEAALALLDAGPPPPAPAGEAATPAPQVPDLLVTDMVMPGLDGAQLLAALRQRLPGLPAIVVSGYAEKMLGRGLDAESLTVVSKPYSLRALLAKADALTGRQHAGGSAETVP